MLLVLLVLLVLLMLLMRWLLVCPRFPLSNAIAVSFPASLPYSF
jgi:hypothetical protein